MLTTVQLPPVLPVDLESIIVVIGGLLLLMIPVAGLTARFAIRPITEAIARMREVNVDRETLQLLERRVALIENEVQGIGALREEVARLVEVVSFDRQLEKGRGEGAS